MSEDLDALRDKYRTLLESAGMKSSYKKSKMSEMNGKMGDMDDMDDDDMESGDPKKKPSKSKKSWMAKKGDMPMEENK